jgi:hypothetical protein
MGGPGAFVIPITSASSSRKRPAPKLVLDVAGRMPEARVIAGAGAGAAGVLLVISCYIGGHGPAYGGTGTLTPAAAARHVVIFSFVTRGASE